MTDDTRTVWMFVCRLNAHDFYALSACTQREFEEVARRIGDRCPVCGAPIDAIDIARATPAGEPLSISRIEL